jgi:hypothetical protein
MKAAMLILRKPLAAISIADLETLCERQARETSELEFKGTLPFKAQKGQPQNVDPWLDNGDRIGPYARDELLAELVAFANADGGTLVIGVHETQDQPRRAERLEPLPKCEELAQRLVDAAEDSIEPRLPVIGAHGVPVDEHGAGYVVMRVAKSLAAPHRLRTTREFYIRRGERAAKMDVREIKDLTLDLARTGDRIEGLFQERRDAARERFLQLRSGWDQTTTRPPLLLRATAVPITRQHVPDITSRRDLWWTGGEFDMQVGSTPCPCSYPAREFAESPEIRLRALQREPDPASGGVQRLLRADRLVEFCFISHRREYTQNEEKDYVLHAGWLIGPIVGALCQVDHLRESLAWDAVEYGLEVEVWSATPLDLRLTDSRLSLLGAITDVKPLHLPQYSVGSTTEWDLLVGNILKDLVNASGRRWEHACEVPWSTLLKRHDH